MISQSQYFDIEDYLQQECRIIEPALLEELIDHFMDGIQAIPESEENFEQAFESVKQDFGGKSGVRKIQRKWQVNFVKINSLKTVQELAGYLKPPKLYWLLMISTIIVAFIFYFKLSLPTGDTGFFLSSFVEGGVSALPLLFILFLIQNRFDFGFWGLQARNWYTIIWMFTLMALFVGSVYLVRIFPGFPNAQLITSVSAVFIGFLYIGTLRFSHRELYQENAWT